MPYDNEEKLPLFERYWKYRVPNQPSTVGRPADRDEDAYWKRLDTPRLRKGFPRHGKSTGSEGA